MAYTYTKRLSVGDNLPWFSDDVGIPDRLRSYLEPEITGKHTEFQDQVKNLRIDLMHLEV